MPLLLTYRLFESFLFVRLPKLQVRPSSASLFSVGRAVRAPALARHRRLKGVTLSRLPDLERRVLRSVGTSLCQFAARIAPTPTITPLTTRSVERPKGRPRAFARGEAHRRITPPLLVRQHRLTRTSWRVERRRHCRRQPAGRGRRPSNGLPRPFSVGRAVHTSMCSPDTGESKA